MGKGLWTPASIIFSHKELSSNLSSVPGTGRLCGKLQLSQFPQHRTPARDTLSIPFLSRAFQAEQETDLGLISQACHGCQLRSTGLCTVLIQPILRGPERLSMQSAERFLPSQGIIPITPQASSEDSAQLFPSQHSLSCLPAFKRMRHSQLKL